MAVRATVLWLSLLVLALPLIGCVTDDDDNGFDTETETETESEAETETVAEAAVVVSDISLDDLSTVVTVDIAALLGPGWVVIHEDGDGTFGAPIGASAPLSAGNNMDVEAFLSRGAVDGETLWAMLHHDTGQMGVLDFLQNDPPIEDDLGNILVEPFVVTVPTGTPAVRLTTTSLGSTSYDFTSAQPPNYADVIGSETGDETLSLMLGWRYEIVNLVPNSHPFEIILHGNSPPGDDNVLLSQWVAGSLEDDMAIDWFDDGDEVIRFNVTAAFADPDAGYRCSIHTGSMRGFITLAP